MEDSASFWPGERTGKQLGSTVCWAAAGLQHSRRRRSLLSPPAGANLTMVSALPPVLRSPYSVAVGKNQPELAAR